MPVAPVVHAPDLHCNRRVGKRDSRDAEAPAAGPGYGRRVRIPGEAEIVALHERLAPHPAALELVLTHCRTVRRLAERLACALIARNGPAVNLELVRAGCLLHDVGVYPLYRPDGDLDHASYVRHGVLGHDLLRDLGFPEVLCRFASRHTGVGLTREDVVAQRLPIPVDDYTPHSVEEQLVAYADAFHSKTDPPTFVTPDTYARRIARFGTDKADRFATLRTRFGEPDLTTLSARHGHRIT